MIPFCFQGFGSFSLSLFGILSQVDSLPLPLLFGLVGISPIPLPAGYSSVSLSWLYYCIWGGLSVFWEFVEFSLLWSFLAVSGVVSVGCQGFLVRVAVSEFWWLELDIFSLECIKCPVMSYEMSMVLE